MRKKEIKKILGTEQFGFDPNDPGIMALLNQIAQWAIRNLDVEFLEYLQKNANGLKFDYYTELLIEIKRDEYKRGDVKLTPQQVLKLERIEKLANIGSDEN